MNCRRIFPRKARRMGSRWVNRYEPIVLIVVVSLTLVVDKLTGTCECASVPPKSPDANTTTRTPTLSKPVPKLLVSARQLNSIEPFLEDRAKQLALSSGSRADSASSISSGSISSSQSQSRQLGYGAHESLSYGNQHKKVAYQKPTYEAGASGYSGTYSQKVRYPSNKSAYGKVKVYNPVTKKYDEPPKIYEKNQLYAPVGAAVKPNEASYKSRLPVLRPVLELVQPEVKLYTTRAKSSYGPKKSSIKKIFGFKGALKHHEPVESNKVHQPEFYIQEEAYPLISTQTQKKTETTKSQATSSVSKPSKPDAPKPEKAEAKKPKPERAEAKKPKPEKAEAKEPKPERAEAKKPKPDVQETSKSEPEGKSPKTSKPSDQGSNEPEATPESEPRETQKSKIKQDPEKPAQDKEDDPKDKKDQEPEDSKPEEKQEPKESPEPEEPEQETKTPPKDKKDNKQKSPPGAAETDPEQKPKPDQGQRPEQVPQNDSEPEDKSEPDRDRAPKPKSEPEPEGEPERESDQKPEPKQEREPKPEPEERPESKDEPEQEPKQESKPGPEAEEKPESEKESKLEPEAEDNPGSEQEQKPEPEPEPQTKSEGSNRESEDENPDPRKKKLKDLLARKHKVPGARLPNGGGNKVPNVIKDEDEEEERPASSARSAWPEDTRDAPLEVNAPKSQSKALDALLVEAKHRLFADDIAKLERAKKRPELKGPQRARPSAEAPPKVKPQQLPKDSIETSPPESPNGSSEQDPKTVEDSKRPLQHEQEEDPREVHAQEQVEQPHEQEGGNGGNDSSNPDQEDKRPDSPDDENLHEHHSEEPGQVRGRQAKPPPGLFGGDEEGPFLGDRDDFLSLILKNSKADREPESRADRVAGPRRPSSNSRFKGSGRQNQEKDQQERDDVDTNDGMVDPIVTGKRGKAKNQSETPEENPAATDSTSRGDRTESKSVLENQFEALRDLLGDALNNAANRKESLAAVRAGEDERARGESPVKKKKAGLGFGMDFGAGFKLSTQDVPRLG